jgi:hypothetical protein
MQPSRYARFVLPLSICLLTAACTPSFTVTPTGKQGYPTTRSVELLVSEPQRPYITIATFSGKEEARCAADVPYCSLREQAKQAGAHAIWIQKRNTVAYPGEWITIEGQLTQLRPFTIDRIEGVLIRYTD